MSDRDTAGSDQLTALIVRDAWVQQAACWGKYADGGPNPFFPPQAVGRNTDMNGALAYCDNCPVTTKCAEAGADQTNGIWGGDVAGKSGAAAARRRNEKNRAARQAQKDVA